LNISGKSDVCELNSENSSFLQELDELIKVAPHPTVFFEFVGGFLPGKILKAMPQNSHMVCVGNITH
jgi:hypothetical protein